MDKKDRKSAKSLETMLYEEARKIYDKELMMISLDDHCIDLCSNKPTESRFSAKDVIFYFIFVCLYLATVLMII